MSWWGLLVRSWPSSPLSFLPYAKAIDYVVKRGKFKLGDAVTPPAITKNVYLSNCLLDNFKMGRLLLQQRPLPKHQSS